MTEELFIQIITASMVAFVVACIIIMITFFSLSGEISKEYSLKIYTFQRMNEDRNKFRILIIRICFGYGIAFGLILSFLRMLGSFR